MTNLNRNIRPVFHSSDVGSRDVKGNAENSCVILFGEAFDKLLFAIHGKVVERCGILRRGDDYTGCFVSI